MNTQHTYISNKVSIILIKVSIYVTLIMFGASLFLVGRESSDLKYPE